MLLPPATPAPVVSAAPPCSAAQQQLPWTPLVPAASSSGPTPASSGPPLASSSTSDYRQQLRPTPAGWPTRPLWCVWIEPAAVAGPAALWEQRWWRAVTSAMASWQQLLPIQLVRDPAEAQVQVQRRRPPIQNRRASHGRAVLQLLQVQRAGVWTLEPQVAVLISPGQAEPALQATALHELGHAFGLWGHSDQPGDAMAVSPGAQPVLELSPRDRATLRWLQAQPGLRQELLLPTTAPASPR